ncbi:MAG TPA: PQQ-binding-like beta-propeller repeat protein [Bryobacteraceae bacterium]|nr:PQQ-binding-like beta-propeller repeat protein [Bryobacteraceae bacterium]
MKKLLFLTCIGAGSLLFAQGGPLDPADLLKPLTDNWTSYSGDYTGRRYSFLKQVTAANVKGLSMAWYNTSITSACGPEGTGAPGGRGGGGGFAFGRGGGGGGGSAPLIVGGLGDGVTGPNNCGPARMQGGVLIVNGVIYASQPGNVYAIDAHDGQLLWHNYWKIRPGHGLGNRGLAMWNNRIFFGEQDDWLVCLDAATGKEIWKKEVASLDENYWVSSAPMVVGNHVLIGASNNLDMPASLQAYDPETGAKQWELYATAQKPGDPGADTWVSLDEAKHGGGTAWIPGAYDPALHLYYYGTGNPTPAYTQGRGDGDNLYTGCLIAVNVDTGKMAWYFATSPHDTHDWDSTETPAIADLPFNGRTRKLIMMATRNGYFYVLDRTTGEHLITSKLGLVNNYASGIHPEDKPQLDARGQVKRNPYKDATIPGSLVNADILNYPPPSFSLQSGLFYINEDNSLHINYLAEPDPRGSMGLGGITTGGSLNFGNFIDAIDYKTGKVVWRHKMTGSNVGLLTTAGGVLFMNNGGGIEALESTTGKPLWQSKVGNLTAPPETFMLDGKQHVVAYVSGGLFMFVLN